MMAAVLLAAVLQPGPPSYASYRDALDLVYEGRPQAARDHLTELGAEDPMGVYLQALVLCWTLEQRPQSEAVDSAFEDRVKQALALADSALKRDPRDVRAWLARGATHGVRSRFHMYRNRRREAARDAVRMREDLLRVRELDPDDHEAAFGLGLYDYYADVLPRMMKLLRFLARMPGGNRERGLASIEEAKVGAVLHGAEVQVQLYEIYAFYEDKPDRALEEILALHARYPGWPLWGLKLAEHLRDRLGAYGRSAAVAEEILARARTRGNDPGPEALALARLSMAESLLLDLKPTEARRALLPIKDGLPGSPALAARARLLLGRSLEIEGDRDGAAAHYRAAADAGDREVRRQAQEALARPTPAAEVRARLLVGEARRHREAGRVAEEALAYREALAAWPRSEEAALGAAEEALRKGDLEEARALLETSRPPGPPFTRPWACLLRAHVLDLGGRRGEAVVQYKKVFQEPHARTDFKQRAAAGLRAPYRRTGLRENS